MTHIRPYNTIRASLVRPKERLSMEEQAGLVYSIKCAECPVSYVGETERPLAKRLKEHRRPESPVCEHMTEESHRFNREDVAARCHEGDWFRHGVAEAICIATDRPSLNRDRGRHTLPAIYSQLLSSRDISDLSVSRESCDDMEASVHLRRPNVTGRKIRTFEDFVLVWMFNKFYHVPVPLPNNRRPINMINSW